MMAARVELVARAVTICTLTAASSVVRLCTVVVSVSIIVRSAAAAVAELAVALEIYSSCATLFACVNAPCAKTAFSLNY